MGSQFSRHKLKHRRRLLKVKAHHIVGCVGMLGLILIINGLFLAFGATKLSQRARIVKQYNARVDEWTARNREIFEQTTFRGQNGQLLVAVTSPEARASSLLAPDVKTYVPLRYETVGVAGNPLPPSNDTLNVSANMTLVAEQGMSQFASNLTLSYDLVRSIVESVGNCIRNSSLATTSPASSLPLCSTLCLNRFGRWNASSARCIIRYVAQSVCVKLMQSGNPLTWKPSITPLASNLGPRASTGCLLNSDASIFPAWSTATLVLDSNGTVTPASLPLTVRSAMDPYVLASELTNGLFDFGTPKPSPKSNASVGLALIFIGLAFMGISVVCILVLVAQKKNWHCPPKPQWCRERARPGLGAVPPPTATNREPPPPSKTITQLKTVPHCEPAAGTPSYAPPAHPAEVGALSTPHDPPAYGAQALFSGWGAPAAGSPYCAPPPPKLPPPSPGLVCPYAPPAYVGPPPGNSTAVVQPGEANLTPS